MSSKSDDIQAVGFDTRLLCSIGLITTHDPNKSGCIVGERKMEFTFFSQLIMVHLSLQPPRTHLAPHRKEVFFLNQKGLVRMMILMTIRRNISMLMSMPLMLCFKDYPKTSTSSSITTLKKAIWDNIKMLLVGSELTKEDRESQLYDEFKCFKMLLGENINEYYVRFHKLVNDVRNIRMTMPNIQLNSKFVNNMSPEWHSSVSSISTIIITSSIITFLITSTQRNFSRGNGVADNGGARIRDGNVNEGQDATNASSREWCDEKELLFLTGEKTNNFDADVDDNPIRDLALNDDNIFQADDCDAFDSDVDDEPTAQSIFMADIC
uniref:Integrase, catalytic region, zinc finger, CCHC-type, peptidase aspartic, catalytic n=1 Tax=Tanacetum cinerariifolium TaxID=118510 RepID=A0A6L2J5W7_TANCI|nr:integrase, catalytic region, zinc finger, CCHC-type, peptidase aspartic, catalytic [Tanacetum cinerariifolium]